jgi:hypothetical protein
MSVTQQQVYHDLERESSDFLLEHDSRRVLGRYAEAAYDALQAGERRARMGQLCFEAGEYAEAVEDWLSAVECFLRATAKKRGAEILALLHRLEADDKLPAERPNLYAALREREQGLNDLRQREQQFLREFALQGHQIDRPEERTLDFLQQQVRSLPGLALLQFAIYRQAWDLGRQELAAQHLVWATTFDPDNANYITLLGYLYLALSEPDRAIDLGNDYLATHSSDTGPVRIMLANAYGLGTGSKPPDQERALAVLQPLLNGADERERISALALCATFHYEIGREPEYRRLLGELDRLEGSTLTPEVRSAITDFRALIPHPDGNRPVTSRQLPAADRQRLFQKAKQVSLKSIPVAA